MPGNDSERMEKEIDDLVDVNREGGSIVESEIKPPDELLEKVAVCADTIPVAQDEAQGCRCPIEGRQSQPPSDDGVLHDAPGVSRKAVAARSGETEQSGSPIMSNQSCRRGGIGRISKCQ